MTREINIGGRQGRGNPKFGLGEDGTLIDLDITKPADRTHSVWGELATGVGLLAEDSYSEPDSLDLPKLTAVERVLVGVILLGSFFGAGSLIVSCTPH